MPAGGYAGVYVPPPSKRWPWVVGALLASILAVFGLQKVGFLHIGSSPPKAVLTQNGKAPNGVLRDGDSPVPPLLQQPGDAPPPILQMPGTVPPPALEDTTKKISMPKDIEDWLKWLEKIEKEKQALTAKEQTQMTTLIASLQGASGLTPQGVRDMADPDNVSNQAPAMDEARTIAKDMIESWSKLKRRFDTYPPPPDCVPIGNAFDNGLEGMADNGKKIEEMMGGVADKPEPGQDDADNAISGVKDVGQAHPHEVDKEFITTDELVQTICDKYDTRKWFSIDAHGGAGNVFSMPGGL